MDASEQRKHVGATVRLCAGHPILKKEGTPCSGRMRLFGWNIEVPDTASHLVVLGRRDGNEQVATAENLRLLQPLLQAQPANVLSGVHRRMYSSKYPL